MFGVAKPGARLVTKQPLDQRGAFAGAGVGGIGLDLLRRRQQAREIQRHATDKLPVAGSRQQLAALRTGHGVDHPVDRVLASVDRLRKRDRPEGQRRLPECALKRKAGLPVAAGCHPGSEQFDLRSRQRLTV